MSVTTQIPNLPIDIYTGKWSGGHIQGIAIDKEHNYIYCSFTTEFVKLDLAGNVIGSVKGFTGHLGCMAYNYDDGRIYASLEYKNDAIGSGILKKLGMTEILDAFYIAIFDCEKIDRVDMNAETDNVMTTVWLKEVIEDYKAVWEENGKVMKHRYGCSGIDGITFAPSFSANDNSTKLYVSYGIYGDTQRSDNDNQVLLSYDPASLKQYEALLTAKNIHSSGPDHCEKRYFVPTGNTTYGVQNMEYDSYTGDIFLAVYEGKKEHFPNFPMYVIDGSKKALQLREDGDTLFLKNAGLNEKGINGYRFPYGATGMISLGNGYFYFSEDKGIDGLYDSHIHLYRYTGDADQPFERL